MIRVTTLFISPQPTGNYLHLDVIYLIQAILFVYDFVQVFKF